MKCLNCVYYDEEYQECEARCEEEGCESFQEVLDLNDLEFLREIVED